MDLRIKKTKRAIRSAFAELIKEKPMEKITVKEIAERAEINKTTFYAHYETVYDLVDQLAAGNRCGGHQPDQHRAKICWIIRVPLLRKFMGL